MRGRAHSTRIRGIRQNRRIRRQHTGTAAATGNNHRHAIHLNSGRTTAGRRIQHSTHATAARHTARNAGQIINRRNNVRRNRRRSLRRAAHTVAVATLSGLQLTITDTTRTGSQSNSLAAAHSHRTLHHGTGTGISHSVVRAASTAHSGKTHTLSTRRNRQHSNLLHAVTGSDHRRILVRAGALAFLIRSRIRRNHRRRHNNRGSPRRTSHQAAARQTRTRRRRNGARRIAGRRAHDKILYIEWVFLNADATGVRRASCSLRGASCPLRGHPPHAIPLLCLLNSPNPRRVPAHATMRTSTSKKQTASTHSGHKKPPDGGTPPSGGFSMKFR